MTARGRGPLPKVAGERQRRNRRQTAELLPQNGAPPVPRKQWLKATKAVWAAYWSSPVAGAVDRRTDEPAVYRLFNLVDLADRAYRSYERQPFIKGSQGQKVVNPQATMMLRMYQELRLLGQELGVGPAARLRLGIQTVKAQEKLDDLDRQWQAEDVPEGADPRLKAL